MDIVSYILSKKYTDQTADAMGSLKGAPCTVKSVTDITGGKRITLEWEGNSGNKETQSFDIMDGEDGKTITSVEINEQEHFIIYYSDGTSDDAGTIDINSAVTSVNGQTGDVSLTASDVGALPDNTSIPTNISDLNNDSGFIDNTVDDLVNYTLSSSLANVATSGNYSDLSGTPTIPMATSDLNNDSNFVSDANYVHTDNNFTDAASTKLAGIAAGAEVNVQSDWNETDNSSDTYIANKPTIPTKVSDLANDTGFVISTVNNLANYYLKTQTYTQAEVNALISAISTITISVVQTLPTTDIQTNVIYLTPKPSAQTNNVYDEYVNTTGTTAGWEKIGDTEIDLSNYVTTTALNTALADYTTTIDLTTLLAAKADASTVNAILDGQNIDSFADVEIALSGKVDKVDGKGLSTNDYTTAEKTKLAGIEAGAEVNPTSGAKTATESFETVNGGLLSKCQIDLVPVQSGSGDPYPAGGGKNKLPLTLDIIKTSSPYATWTNNVAVYRGVTCTVQVDDGGNVIGINSNGTASGGNSGLTICKKGTVDYSLFAGKTFIINGGYNNDYYIQFWTSNGAIGVSKGSDSASFTVPSEEPSDWNITLLVIDTKQVSNYISKPMLRLSTESDPTFAPYSNVRPISGHTEVDLYNVGKNLLSGYEQGGFDTDGSDVTPPSTNRLRSEDFITVESSTKYTISSSSSVQVNVFEFASIGSGYSATSGWKNLPYTFESSATTRHIRVMVRYSNNANITPSDVVNPQIEKGSTTTSFEPYNPSSHLYQVQIGSTVYGGYVDLVSGVMTITHAIVDLGSLTGWVKHPTAHAFYTGAVTDFAKVVVSGNLQFADGLCDSYKYIQQTDVEGIITLFYNTNIASSRLFIFDSQHWDSMDATQFKAYLSGKYLCYELAAPQTIQLTPQQIETLVGQNNLSTPLDGQSIETNGVEYKELFTFADVVNRVDVKAGTGEESVVMNHINGSYTNTASGRWSTATGYNSTSSGDFSYTEGYGCIASALYTHAEGVGNQATSRASHAEGDTNKAIANSAHAEGYDTIAGYYNESTQTYTGTSSHAEGISTRTYGNGSHAEGWQSRAEAIYSHAEGEITVASAEAAHTEGIQTTASGYAAHAEGASSQATGNYSHVEGSYGVASGNCSHAGGLRSEASSNQSFAHGNTVTASNKFSAAFGISNYEKLSSGDNDNTYTLFSVGNGTIVQSGTTYVKDTPSNAFEVRKNGTVIEGSGCGANGNAAHAEGNGTHANGNCSHAEGNIGTASGYAAHVEGNGCTASGDDAHAEGAWTMASGVVSHAGGDASRATAYGAFAHGNQVVAANANDVAFGIANDDRSSQSYPNDYTLFSVGNGEIVNGTVTTRHNAFEVRSNGDVLANNSKLISVSELQTIVASCTDFSDFKTAIAAL